MESSWIRLSFWTLLIHPFLVQNKVHQVTSKLLDQVLDGIQSLCSQANARRCCCKGQCEHAKDSSMSWGTYSPNISTRVQQLTPHQGKLLRLIQLIPALSRKCPNLPDLISCELVWSCACECFRLLLVFQTLTSALMCALEPKADLAQRHRLFRWQS